MASVPGDQPPNIATTEQESDQSLKLAIAISLLRSKLLQKQPSNPDLPPPLPSSDALRWKRKAKERKQEILRLREDLKEAEVCDLFPKSASCKCYFFENLGKFCPNQDRENSDTHSHQRVDDVLRRRFLRQVRLKERRRPDCSNRPPRLSGINSEHEAEQLSASVDFLVEICETVSPAEEGSFANWSHQAVDFILASLKSLLSIGKISELTEGIVNNLIVRLVKRMCIPSNENELNDSDNDAQFYIQHLMRKLGRQPYIGQRAILSISQRILVIAEGLLFLHPFDESFPNMHRCLFIMIQLIEFLISDYLLTWSSDDEFENVLFEEWVVSLVQARKALELLENRNGLYVVYMDRVLGELAKLVGQVQSLRKINPEILHSLLC